MKPRKPKASKHLKPGKRLEKKAPLLKVNMTTVQITTVQPSGPHAPPPPLDPGN
jgi:hypothetical protein